MFLACSKLFVSCSCDVWTSHVVCSSSFQGVLALYENYSTTLENASLVGVLWFTCIVHLICIIWNYLAVVTIVLICPLLGNYNPQIKFEHACISVVFIYAHNESTSMPLFLSSLRFQQFTYERHWSWTRPTSRSGKWGNPRGKGAGHEAKNARLMPVVRQPVTCLKSMRWHPEDVNFTSSVGLILKSLKDVCIAWNLKELDYLIDVFCYLVFLWGV